MLHFMNSPAMERTSTVMNYRSLGTVNHARLSRHKRIPSQPHPEAISWPEPKLCLCRCQPIHLMLSYSNSLHPLHPVGQL